MNYKIHHIGYVVKDILSSYEVYSMLDFKVVDGFEKPKKDIHQDVNVGALKKDGVFLELLQPLSQKSPVYATFLKGGGIHHVCYEVEDIARESVYLSKELKSRQISKITTSVWGNGSKVTFFMLKDNSVIELIEKNGEN